MIIFLTIVVILLIGFIFLQHRTRKRHQKNLTYIHHKLAKILDEKSNEKLLVHTDDEELKKILIEINRLLEQNQKVLADYSRTEMSMRKMLANISHDLKTPLTVVLGYIEIMKMDPANTKDELHKVHQKTLEVLELINKFFHLTKLESGDKEIALARINMNELCRKNILNFYDVLVTKGFEVQIDIPDGPLYILGNEDELDRVFHNLLSNAIQYGSDGKIIGIKLYADDEYVYAEVWDRGKGISALHQDLVFERMYTLEDSRNKQYQGSGLGLTITKRLVEKMGGEVLLTSTPFEKTTFTVKLNRVNF